MSAGRGRRGCRDEPPGDTVGGRRPRPLVIPVFVPHAGCPHRCIFCDQAAVTGRPAAPPEAGVLREQVEGFLAHRTRPRGEVQIAFFGGNFLGLEADVIEALLAEAQRYVAAGTAGGIRFSTRPDTVTPERLALLRNFSVTTVEIGAQSMSDDILRASHRGHGAADSVRAVRRLKAAGYETGLQLMVGLPGETAADTEASGRAAAELRPDFVRIYPTLVLSGSPLADWYRSGRYRPLRLDEAVERVKALYRYFSGAGIRVVRMGLQASADLADPGCVLAGPYHPAFGELVLAALFLEAAAGAAAAGGGPGGVLQLAVNPRSESRLRGMGNRNLRLLEQMGTGRPAIETDSSLAENELRVNGRPVSVYGIRPSPSETGGRHAARPARGDMR